jgi:hypothetical protein
MQRPSKLLAPLAAAAFFLAGAEALAGDPGPPADAKLAGAPEPAASPPAPAPAADKPAADKPAAAEPPPSSASDLGEPPPKTTGASGETKLSPLTPEPGEFPKGGVAPPPVSYDKLLGQIAALRSRVAAVTTTLYKSKLKVSVAAESDDAVVAGFVVTLDDGVVYTAPERFSPEELQVVYSQAVAPGHHVVGIEVERYDSRNREYRTWQSSKFTVVVPENKTLSASVIVEDDSDMAEDFPDDQDGEFELNVRLRAQVEE